MAPLQCGARPGAGVRGLKSQHRQVQLRGASAAGLHRSFSGNLRLCGSIESALHHAAGARRPSKLRCSLPTLCARRRCCTLRAAAGRKASRCAKSPPTAAWCASFPAVCGPVRRRFPLAAERRVHQVLGQGINAEHMGAAGSLIGGSGRCSQRQMGPAVACLRDADEARHPMRHRAPQQCATRHARVPLPAPPHCPRHHVWRGHATRCAMFCFAQCWMSSAQSSRLLPLRRK